MSPWSWKPQLATWYPVRGLITFAQHVLRQIWKNMILVKPKIVGQIFPDDMNRFMSNSDEMEEVTKDLFVSLIYWGQGSERADLKILQGDMNIADWFEGFKRVMDFIFLGFSQTNESTIVRMRTTSEIFANQEVSGETIGLLKQLRLDQWTRIFDKVLIIERLWDGKGERPYTLSIPDEENMNKSIEIEEANLRYNTGYVFAPRPLFPKWFLPAVNHPLNTQLKAEESYRLVVGIQPVVDFYNEWKENKKSAYDESVKSSFEGHIRTNFDATTNVKFTLGSISTEDMWQIWKNFVTVFGKGLPKDLPVFLIGY